MVILLISDLHKTLESAEEVESVRWLLHVLDGLEPEVLVSAGDWGEAMTVDDFFQIASRVRLVTVYGNHENFSAVRSFVLRDGEVVEAGGFRIAGVNGLVCGGAEYCTPPGRFRRAVSKIGSVDIFASHQPPSAPYPQLEGDETAELMRWALEKIRPRLHFSGHMAGGRYSLDAPDPLSAGLSTASASSTPPSPRFRLVIPGGPRTSAVRLGHGTGRRHSTL
ncbi:MAG: metallophosphoesterase family protein [Pyrobaculum sp.]|jgi:predicted phosphodiesterase